MEIRQHKLTGEIIKGLPVAVFEDDGIKFLVLKQGTRLKDGDQIYTEDWGNSYKGYFLWPYQKACRNWPYVNRKTVAFEEIALRVADPNDPKLACNVNKS